MIPSRFDPKPLYGTPNSYNCTMFHKAVAELDLNLVKNILASGEVNVHELNTFALLKFSDKKQTFLQQNFQSAMRTTAIAHLFEKEGILDICHENLLLSTSILQVNEKMEFSVVNKYLLKFYC